MYSGFSDIVSGKIINRKLRIVRYETGKFKDGLLSFYISSNKRMTKLLCHMVYKFHILEYTQAHF